MNEEREFNLELGRRIRTARRRAGLTQEALADEVDLSRTSITNIESGNQPVSAWLLHLVAAAVNSDPRDLLPSGASAGESRLPADVPPKTAAILERIAQSR